MTTAGFLQLCLVLGTLMPLASFVFLGFFGARLGRSRGAPRGGDAPSGALHGSMAHAYGHAAGARGAAPPGPGEPLAGWIATGAIAFSLLTAVVAVFVWAGTPVEARAALEQGAIRDAVYWATLGHVPLHFGVKLDSLTVIMSLMVTLCATCIHVFSIGYMAGDPRFSRFFAFLSLFCFSMLGLVISSNLLLTFIFWELVGVCSYFLIGFWFEKRSASNAALKAFVVNRVGDFGFTVGLALCLIHLGTLSLDAAPPVFEAGAHQAGLLHGEPTPAAQRVRSADAERAAALFTTSFFGVSLATWLGIGLFCGAIGKSAQFPLHVWLPDAMEGPTPVSALIHAATMVAAGVYLVARVFTLLTPAALMFIAVIGCITLTLAALMAIVQVDIKRVLAYSTLSQLGYMIFGLGVGAWTGALFHLLTHGFFKALLFLGAGQVIAGCHHEQDIRKMGGLWVRMPRTAWTFLIAVLAISGFGIPWTPLGVGGFYSKDEILAVAYHRTFDRNETTDRSETGPPVHASSLGRAWGPPLAAAGPVSDRSLSGASAAAHAPTRSLPLWLFLLPLAVAYITPFYMGRCFVLTFMGCPRDERVYQHAHESRVMYGPLVVLAALTLVSGWFVFRGFVAAAVPPAGALVPAIDGRDHALHAAHAWLPLLVGFAWAVGLGAAWRLYRNGLDDAERIRTRPVLRRLHALFWSKFYFDDLYNAVVVGGTRALAVATRLVDEWIIDPIVNTLAYLAERISRFAGVVLDNLGVDGLVDGVARLSWMIGGALRGVQTGVIRNYVMFAALGAGCFIVGFWSVYLGVVIAVAGVTLIVRKYVPLIVLAVVAAVVLGYGLNPYAATAVLIGALLALAALGRSGSAAAET